MHIHNARKSIKTCLSLQKALKTVNNIITYLYTTKIRLTLLVSQVVLLKKGSHLLKYTYFT